MGRPRNTGDDVRIIWYFAGSRWLRQRRHFPVPHYQPDHLNGRVDINADSGDRRAGSDKLFAIGFLERLEPIELPPPYLIDPIRIGQ
jgi:hypothetical protein